MKNLTWLLLILVWCPSIYSCTEGDSEKTGSLAAPAPLPSKDLREVNIGFANLAIKLPKDYKKYYLVENYLYELGLSREYGNQDISNFTAAMEKLNKAGQPYELYADTTSLLDLVLIMDGPRVDFNKKIGRTYTKMLEQQMSKNYDAQGVSYRKVESKFLTTTNNKVIKVKYEMAGAGYEKVYVTQYLISTPDNTLSVNVRNLTLQDFQDQVVRLKHNF
ncbi:hypothetical protein AB9P05_20030 [Roseivirga sp. BDSF3-8]|uniref:hypothetical protein n=1 Tax=Roseivirga sp. BDSF3-8 TaxID=3241598 RepID=UPI0035324FD2